MSAAIPIVLVHKSNSDYLPYTLLQAMASNPDNPLVLLGDCDNDRYDFVEHRNLEDYSNSSEMFCGVYRHFSRNGLEYERFCFERWFILKDYMESGGIESCFYMDSDVLLYGDLQRDLRPFSASDVAFSGMWSGHSAFFNGISALKGLCETFMRMYSDPLSLERMSSRFGTDPYFNVCDMFGIQEFVAGGRFDCADNMQVIEGVTFDHNINASNGYRMRSGLKELQWIDGQPHAWHYASNRLVRFVSLHCQGKAKAYMRDFVTATVPSASCGQRGSAEHSRTLEGGKGTVFFHHPRWTTGTWRDVLLSYARSFAPSEDVSLVLWLDPEQGLSLQEVTDQITGLLHEEGLTLDAIPDVLLIPDALDEAGVRSLYASADWCVPHQDVVLRNRAQRAGTRILGDLSSESWRIALADSRQRV